MMTNEEAICELENLLIVADDDFLKKSEAIRTAIEALRLAEEYKQLKESREETIRQLNLISRFDPNGMIKANLVVGWLSK